ncbi:hypothetical protein [Helicobacter apodemus]|uniref:hypothetical protein n=1 Tax=Helicobacter apodemus TaxID=135569 RepID=UPI001EF33FCD|nr:hypothetical protein [Helicobacter apodemus]
MRNRKTTCAGVLSYFEAILLSVGFSFDVNYKDIALEDILHNPQALPRYDCNLFEYGQANLG